MSSRVAFPQVAWFQARLKELDGLEADSWVVGDVVSGGGGTARLAEGGPRLMEV
jgi:hypothetical protein